jgi:hypothetical protein
MADRSIVDVGRFLQKYGLKIGEHPEFGGVTGGHAKGSYHYTPGGSAIDVTDWRPDVAPAYEGGKPIPWKQRTGELAWRAKQLGVFKEALGPGDKGHETHVHLALPGKTTLSDQQLEWLATGRTKDPSGRLTDVMPGAAQVAQAAPSMQQPGTITYNVFVPQQKQQEQPVTAKDLLASFVEDYKQQRSSASMTPDSMYAAMAKAAADPSTSLFGLG